MASFSQSYNLSSSNLQQFAWFPMEGEIKRACIEMLSTVIILINIHSTKNSLTLEMIFYDVPVS